MKSNKLYVGNLSYSVNYEELKELFGKHGTVQHVKIIEGRGFGFVEMESQAEAEKAMTALNNCELNGRILKVAVARPQRRDRSNYNS